MADSVERVAIELVARVDGFDGTMKQTADQFGNNMTRIEGSADRAERAISSSFQKSGISARQMQQNTRQLGFQISDIGAQLSTGTSPFIVLAQQGSQVAMALEGSKGAVGRLAAFLTGPFGAAALAATSILGVFLFANNDARESVDDMVDSLRENANKAADAEAAQSAFANTLEGVEAAIRDNQEALDELNLVQDNGAEAALAHAEAQRKLAIKIRETTEAALAYAIAQYEVNQASGAIDPISGALIIGSSGQEVGRLQAALARAEAATTQAENQVVEAGARVVVEQETASAADQINRRYDAQVDGARRAAVASGANAEALRGEIRAIQAARAAELERDRESNRRGRRGADPVAAEARRVATAERARVEEERRVQSFENELAQLYESQVDARKELIESAAVLAQLEMASIEVARAAYNDNVASLVSQRRLTEEEAGQLRGINDERARLRTELVRRREAERVFRTQEADLRRAADTASARADVEAEILDGQNGIAETQAERRNIERRLIGLQFLEEKARNDYLIGLYERLRIQEGVTETELADAAAAAEIAALRNESIAQRQETATQQSDAGTAGPLEDFFASIPDNAAQTNEALESIAAGGLATFTDALTDAIVNFESLGDVGLAVLHNITAALVKLAIQQILLKTIGDSLGKATTASTSAAAATAAAAWAPAAALASLATLGANAGPAAAALAATSALSAGIAATAGLARKDGGPIYGPGGPRSDSVAVRASNGEYMIKASSAKRLGRSALDRINATGELPSAFSGRGPAATTLNPANASAAAANGGSRASELGPDSVRQLEGIVAGAIAAMPDVKLYPTLDPASVMKAALDSPGGQRAMFDFVQSNSGKFRGSLGT